MTFVLQTIILMAALSTTVWSVMNFRSNLTYKILSEIKAEMKKMDETHSKDDARIDHLYEICVEILKSRK
jgi:hypothetical protein